MNTPEPLADTDFLKKLHSYQELLDERIQSYSTETLIGVDKKYGQYSATVAEAYFDLLNRGGKRLRGALTMLGYEMCGGKDKEMILDAAMAIEMVHSYILIVDDFQDKSEVRRGGPSVHRMLEGVLAELHLDGDREHLGASLSWNAALFGSHAAHMVLANLDVEAEARLKVISILSNTMLVTAHGQTNDIINELRADVNQDSVNDVMLWKTAYYTFLNPLHVGMVLAGAGCEDTDAITEYALGAGMVFQITDDILGTFGEEFESGKSPMDDLREGKRTLLTVYALEHATKTDRNFLIQMLGNDQLTDLEFSRCREILEDSGALKYAQQQAKTYADKAVQVLKAADNGWKQTDLDFLKSLVQYLLSRKS